MLQFIRCCAYFQVTGECWEAVQKLIRLPSLYSHFSQEDKSVWVRQVVPFPVARQLILKASDPIQSLHFVFAWFNESAAASPCEKRTLETCEDFFRMREMANCLQGALRGLKTNNSYPTPLAKGQNYALTRPQAIATSLVQLFLEYPVAANCIETTWLAGLLQYLHS